MSNNLSQLKALSQPKIEKKLQILSENIAKQTDQISKLPSNKESTVRALKRILICTKAQRGSWYNAEIKETAKQLRLEAQKLEYQYIDPQKQARVKAAIAELEARLLEKQGATELERAACMFTNKRIHYFNVFFSLFLFL